MEHGENCEAQLNKIGLIEGEKEMKTTDLLTNETFIVKANLLFYKGKRYTFDDVAVKWRKDCRMWLWKNTNKKKNCNTLDELQRNFENVDI